MHYCKYAEMRNSFQKSGWKASLVPLHKEGSEKNLGNYRGITLRSHIGKVYCRVLKERLCRAVDGVVLGEAQGGFRKNRQTVDHLFFL